MNKRVLDINDLNVGFSSYGETTKIVTDVSFHIDEGETVGIVGESGCGKSMTALSVMRLIKCPPGYIKGEITFWSCPSARCAMSGGRTYP